ncbi:male-specific lethal 3 homolog isoform X2 [Mizuhopecten yessoensis]|uniref:male-specific lethal 3 homolog isoform X2 n=1 Tax=Mizuhopecten yessoensis TaxID=6573 RepID=UPI000B45A4F3|nr:male-specific lethal 3 homolog isoform X2 [Mizuhopecten yessoensis]
MSTRGIKYQYSVGECVLCFEPDPTKARVLYDAKILDQTFVKDVKNHTRKTPAYHIHFQGWNNSWDRVVVENHILKNDETNRDLMKRLADITKRYRINRARNHRIDQILKEAFKGRPPLMDYSSDFSDDNDDCDDDDTEVETDDEDETDETDKENNRVKDRSTNGDADVDSVDGSESSSRTSGKSEDKKKQTVELEIPEVLKEVLEGDFIAINKECLLIQLPADTNIVDILEGFVKTFCINLLCGTPEKGKTAGGTSHIPFDKNIPLCKELVDGLRICFDHTLPLVLLYTPERDQYKELLQNKFKPNPESKTNSLQSPLIKTPMSKAKQFQGAVSTTPGTGDSSPKIPKLSPKVFKREKIEFDLASKSEEVTPRRLTRQAAQDSAKKYPTFPQEASSSTDEVDIEKRGEVTPNKRRESRRRKYSDSSSLNPVAVKMECGYEGSEGGGSGVVSRRADPPPPLLIPSVISNQASGHGSVDSSGDSVQPTGRENIVESVLAWKLLPEKEAIKIPPYPSLVYGAHHLLRLFVKLPELILSMDMEDHKLKALQSLLDHFMDYLVERRDDLFPDVSYESQ